MEERAEVVGKKKEAEQEAARKMLQLVRSMEFEAGDRCGYPVGSPKVSSLNELRAWLSGH